MIRVVHLSSTEAKGGAALAARRLHQALNASGRARSTMFVAQAEQPGAETQEFRPLPGLPRKVNQILYRVGRRLGRRVQALGGALFSQEWTSFGRAPLWQIPPADVYHLHWISDLVDFRMLAPLARRGHLVWTCHDMNPFTGGCHYDEGCGCFAAACGACPRLGSMDLEDPSAKVLRRKESCLATLPDHGLSVVCPSRWLAGEARRSHVFGRFNTQVIPNGIDLESFRPLDRTAARARFGLREDARVMLFVAESLDDGRKGWAELEQALGKVTGVPHLQILTLGSGDTQRMSGSEFHHLGHLSDPDVICAAYSAADIFVIPSLQDNFPNTVIEALACGTPVVGFATGGITDAVEHGGCGLLAPTGDTAALAAQIVRALTDDALRAALATTARKRALDRYGVDRQAQAYVELYEAQLGVRREVRPMTDALTRVDPAGRNIPI